MQLIKKYFKNNLTEEQLTKFAKLPALYQEWNAQINVVSRKDIDNLEERHLLHSIAMAKCFTFPKGSTLLDIGTGGGFPGLPLAIFFPEANFYLVDSIGKKIKVVEEITKALQLNNVSYAHQRAEKVKGQFDFIISRAVAKTEKLLNWTCSKIKIEGAKEKGFIFLKGGNLEEELTQIKTPYQLTNLRDYFEEQFFETKKILYIPY